MIMPAKKITTNPVTDFVIKPLSVYVVMFQDGDGAFLDKVFFKRKDADDYVKEKEGLGHYFYLTREVE
jgi:hypothetical protein